VNPAVALTTRFVAALADLGLRHAVLSPGSRNTPLALAFAVDPRITHHVVRDERSGGFAALGIAKSTGVPAATVCTSGTAAAHYLPAVVEARHARVPLLVLTADRPPELRGAGAPQTIDQSLLFGANVRLFADVGVPDETTAGRAELLALRSWTAAVDAPPGPVHLNFPFREPLAVPRGPAPAPGLRHDPGYRVPDPETLDDLAAVLSARKALLVCGGRMRPGFAAAASLVAAEGQIPVLADVQCRFPSPATIAYPHLLAGDGTLDRLTPDVVLRVGALPTSKALWQWLEQSGIEQVYLDDGEWREPLGSASRVVRGDPAATLVALTGRLRPPAEAWLERWLEADAAAAERLNARLRAEPFPNEPAIARTVMASLPPDAIVYVGSSMPIRDVDAFAGIPRTDVEVLANRGANGIDGLLASAAGAALASERPVVVLAGDLSFLHDVGTLTWIARFRPRLRLVVVDNAGGGIFHFLPQARTVAPDLFEELFATPHGVDLVELAGALGIPGRRVEDDRTLAAAAGAPVEGPELIAVPTDRTGNVAVHDRLT